MTALACVALGSASDIGWVISRHGALYAQEYGWDVTLEALVAEIAARFLKRFSSSTFERRVPGYCGRKPAPATLAFERTLDYFVNGGKQDPRDFPPRRCPVQIL